MSATCEDCGADYGTVGVLSGGPRKEPELCRMCVEREGIKGLPPRPPSIDDLPTDSVCGNCGRKRSEHRARSDWERPTHGLYFNEPIPLVRRIAEIVGYKGLSDRLWMSDLEGLVEHVKRKYGLMS